MVSSNLAYYEGGCQSKQSSKKTWDTAENTGCVEQGECNAAYLFTTNGATTKPGLAHAVPTQTQTRFMVGTTWDGAKCSANYAKIAGYAPGSDVTQHNRIDLDQKEMEAYLGEGVPNWAKAKAIYENGAYSGAYARVTVPAIPAAIKKADSVSQAGNTAAKGYVKSDKAAGVTSVDITYTSTCIDNAHSKGYSITGCYKANGGAISIKQGASNIGNPSAVQNKYRTLAGFSTKAGSKMATQTNFGKFKSYYTNADYAHRYVLDAFAGTGLFAGKDNGARIQGVKKGSAYMNVWMYVIHEMEDAIGDCKSGCITCNDDPVHAWDEAVAFYTGTLEGVNAGGLSAGKMLYRLANKRCANFKTCAGGMTTGNSQVNVEMFKLFTQGKVKLQNGECAAVPGIKNSIVSLMTVPMIQGSLRYAYKVAKLSGGSVEKAEGAVFSAAVLPLVHACSASAATTISKNLAINTATPMTDGFPKVKAAFESTYACLGITCAHVGGLIQQGTNYYADAAPCGDQTASSDSKGNSMFFAVAVISYIITLGTQ
jgi:hypothetical protein